MLHLAISATPSWLCNNKNVFYQIRFQVCAMNILFAQRSSYLTSDGGTEEYPGAILPAPLRRTTDLAKAGQRPATIATKYPGNEE